MSCLHCQFQVIKHHIGSNSNPNLGLEVPSQLLNFVLLLLIFFFFWQNLYFLLLTLANGKSFFFFPPSPI